LQPKNIFALLISAILVAGCAYFNTFHNAQVYYREGMKLKKQGQGSLAGSKFDKAIEKSALVISRYPRSSWVDDALFLIGRCYFEKSEFARAAKYFEQLRLVFPQSKFGPEADLYRGLALIRDGKTGTGKLLLEALKRNHPHWNEAVSFHLAITELELDDQKTGIDSLLSFVHRFPRSRYYLYAARELSDNYLRAQNYAQAESWYYRYSRLESDVRKRTEAQVKIALCRYHQERYDEALKMAENILGRYSDMDEELYLIIGKTQLAIGKDMEAIATLSRVRANNANGAEAGFLIGKFYEEHRDFTRARAYYDSAKLRRAESEFGVLATKRASLLNAFTQDTTDNRSPPEVMFLLAEVHNLNLAEFDSAMTIYQRVADSFPESDWAPKALLAKGWILLRVKGDTTQASQVLNQLISRYPRSEYAEQARRWLGIN